LLVGGFGESPYLQNALRERFEKEGIQVICADEPSKVGSVLKVISSTDMALFSIESCG
jgi:hypothetical protein